MQDKDRVGGKVFPPSATLSMRAVAADQSSEDEGANESDQVKAYRALLSAMIDCKMLEVRGETSVVVTRKRSVLELCIVLSVNSVLAAGRKRRGGGMMP
jgi:hypothetical protein